METQAELEVNLLDLIRIAYSMLSKTRAYLLYRHPDAVTTESDSHVYSIDYNNAILSSITNIFDICDICSVELKYQDTIESSAKQLSPSLKRTHLSIWEYYGTFITRNVTANNKTIFYVSKTTYRLI